MKVRIRDAAGAAAVIVCASCSSPTGPTGGPPPVSEITLTCPADIRIGNVPTPAQMVVYPLPTATGGVPPIKIACSPPSNTEFPLGTTPVMCSGTDGVRTGVCSFNVILVPPQAVLSVQNLLAFGDSITAGENGEGSFRLIDGQNSYPMQLFVTLQARYTTESVQVHNCGIRGETADQGETRINRVLGFYNPDALLVLEGVNNLTGQANFGGQGGDADTVRRALSYDIGVARGRGMPGIFLSTLLPLFPGNCTPSTPQCRGAEVDATELANMNDVIRGVAAQEGVPLVDNYSAFLGHPEYVDNDGLHPLPLGNQVIANQFFTAIRSKFETQTPTAASPKHTSPLDVSPDLADCPYDGNTAVVMSRSLRR